MKGVAVEVGEGVMTTDAQRQLRSRRARSAALMMLLVSGRWLLAALLTWLWGGSEMWRGARDRIAVGLERWPARRRAADARLVAAGTRLAAVRADLLATRRCAGCGDVRGTPARNDHGGGPRCSARAGPRL